MIDIECPTCSGMCEISREDLGVRVECPYCNDVFTAAERRAVEGAGIVPISQDDIQPGQMSIAAFMDRHNIDGGVELQADGKKSINSSAVIQSNHGDRYSVGNVVAQGGMGAILHAKDLNCRRPVAMKVLLPEKETTPDAVLRFIEEAQVTAQLEHPNIVPLHEMGVDAAENVYYTMKMVKGTTLEEILSAISRNTARTIKAYPLQRLLTIFMRVCDAIAFANSRGVIHRDLKPANIMVGEFGEVLVMDWGLAKVLGRDDDLAPMREYDDEEVPEWVIDSIRNDGVEEATKTMQGDILGTPAYMAPEQAMGKIDQIDTRTDIYALGGILFNILTLKTPIKATAIHAMLIQLCRGEIAAPAERVGNKKLVHLEGGKIPAALSAVAMKALALHQDDRYQNVQELQREIEAWQGGFATEAEDAGSLQLVKLAVARHKKEVALIVAALLMLAAGTAIAFWRVNAEKKIAQNNAMLAQENADAATAARNESERNANAATAAKNESEQNLLIAERSNYISQINLAQANIENANYDAARAILAACPEAYRHFEWARLELLTDIGDQLFRGHRQALDSVSFSADGSQILTSGKDGTAKLWDTENRRVLVTFRDEHRIRIRSAAISPDGTQVLTGNYDSMVKLWDVATGNEVRRFEGGPGNVESVAFSPDGKWIGAAVDGGTATIWDRESGKTVQTFGPKKKMTCFKFSPDGERIATSSPSGVHIWNIASGKVESRPIPGYSFSLAYSPDGRRLASVGMYDVFQWDFAAGQTVESSKVKARHLAVAYSPDGKRLLSGSDKTTILWDAASG